MRLWAIYTVIVLLSGHYFVEYNPPTSQKSKNYHWRLWLWKFCLYKQTLCTYSSYNERETVIRETLYWVGLKYVLQTLDAIRYLCQQLQDILEDMEGYWKLIMVFLWQVDLVFPYPTQHFRHLNSIMYSLCVIQDFYLIAWDQTDPCHSDIIDTDNNYKNEFKNVFLKCTCVHNCAAVFTFSQSEVVGAVCLLPPLLSKKKKLQTGSESYRLQRPT